MKLISFDLIADMAFLKKPDINDGIYLTYNMLHKPCLLGILGAIIGLKGFEKNSRLPEYYQKLKDLKVGIQPLSLEHRAFPAEKGNFQKTLIRYNNSVGYASFEVGGNLIVTEQTLLSPAFRCYLLLDEDREEHVKIFDAISKQEAVYLPYLGKNEHSVWWENMQEYTFEENPVPQQSFQVISIIRKYGNNIKDKKARAGFKLGNTGNEQKEASFMYFERLPVAFDEVLYQYELDEFAFTSIRLKGDSEIPGLYSLNHGQQFIQLF